MIAVVTNIDPEHLDHYGSFEALHDAFVAVREPRAVLGPRGALPRPPGRAGDPAAHDAPHRRPTASRRRPTCVATRRRDAERGGMRFAVRRRGERSAPFALRAARAAQRAERARHARRRARARRARSRPRPRRSRASAASSAASRRKGEARGVRVVDDYGHHPAEIRATLAAAREVHAGPRRGRLPAAPLHAHARPLRRVRARLPRRRRAGARRRSTPRARTRSRASRPRRWPRRCAPTATATCASSPTSTRVLGSACPSCGAGRSRDHARRRQHLDARRPSCSRRLAERGARDRARRAARASSRTLLGDARRASTCRSRATPRCASAAPPTRSRRRTTAPSSRACSRSARAHRLPLLVLGGGFNTLAARRRAATAS